MTTDLALKYLGTPPVPAGINAFYARRVLQRCEQGEITQSDATELLMTAAKRGGAEMGTILAVGTANSVAFTRR